MVRELKYVLILFEAHIFEVWAEAVGVGLEGKVGSGLTRALAQLELKIICTFHEVGFFN